MNDNQKTILDILAEMRKECGDADSRYLGKRIIHRMEDTRVRQYCDRLEAAARRAYNQIDSAVCGIEDAASCEIDYVRKAMENTIGDYYE